MQKTLASRDLNSAEVIYLTSIDKDDITLEKLKELFAFTRDREPRFNPSDKFILKKGALYNDKDEKTTVGRYIFNKLILDSKLGNLLGYINETINGGSLGSIEDKLSQYLLKDIITVSEFTTFVDKVQWLGFSTASFINTSMTTNLVIAPEKVKQRREELLMKYEKELEEGSLEAISKIEDELLTMSRKELEGLADMDIYDSGSRGSFGNNYKLTAIIRGANKNFANPSEIRISKSNLEEGIDPKELHMYGDIMTAGSAGRALGTADGG